MNTASRTACRSLALLLTLGFAAPTLHADCGRISTFDVSPRNQQLFPAVLIAIDGKAPATTASATFRVPVGRHTLTVAEAIDPIHFSRVAQIDRDRRSRDRYKTIEVEVMDDTTYRLAAKLHLDRRNKVRSGEYWDPQIWSEVTEGCN
jgi:hypothetical protein